jgi:hypothetical protein
MNELVRYDAMLHAIAECHRVDEVKDIHDRAFALEVYARQMKNIDAERQASDIRIRAERQYGKLLKELARVTPQEKANRANAAMGRSSNDVTNVEDEYAAALERTGVSRQSASRYQALADVPDAVFEEHLRAPSRSTSSIIQAAREPCPQMPVGSLWLWGQLRDFERKAPWNTSVKETLEGMTESMRADVVRLVPRVMDFLSTVEECLNESATEER